MAHSSIANLQVRAAAPPEVGRRSVDILIACIALAVFGPVMFLIALAIGLESGRPILFSQLRLGQHGRAFRMYKFRKFRKECGTAGPPLTLEGDARLTTLGKVLRATKLDELPQFWNVLKGDMSIIGPRPETLEFADCFSSSLEKVLDYKPGIFGPSQVVFRNESSLYPADADLNNFYRTVLFPAKAHIDLNYYCHRTLVSDVGWIIRGVLAVLGWAPAATSGLLADEPMPSACVRRSAIERLQKSRQRRNAMEE